MLLLFKILESQLDRIVFAPYGLAAILELWTQFYVYLSSRSIPAKILRD